MTVFNGLRRTYSKPITYDDDFYMIKLVLILEIQGKYLQDIIFTGVMTELGMSRK